MANVGAEKMILDQIVLWRISFHVAMNNVSFLQDSLEGWILNAIKQSSGLSEKGRKTLEDWLAHCKKSRDEFLKTIEESINDLEKILMKNNFK